jgi:hypothetical protein
MEVIPAVLDLGQGHRRGEDIIVTVQSRKGKGATALIAIIGGSDIHAMGYYYVLMPVGLGAGIMLLVALLVNNIPEKRHYPEFWF